MIFFFFLIILATGEKNIIFFASTAKLAKWATCDVIIVEEVSINTIPNPNQPSKKNLGPHVFKIDIESVSITYQYLPLYPRDIKVEV